MTRLLLHFPWTLIEAATDLAARETIQRFFELLSRTDLEPAQFLEAPDCEPMYNTATRRVANALLFRFMKACHRQSTANCSARPEPEPSTPALTDGWKRGLCDQLIAVEDWRNPQIIVPGASRNSWGLGEEVAVHRDVCDERNASGPHLRVIALLEDYAKHRFASSDRDPWDLQRVYPENDPNGKKPAILPRPPWLAGVSLENLDAAIAANPGRSWDEGGYRYFVPPKGFAAMAVEQARWRDGRAFPFASANTRKGIKTGPQDVNGVVWSFDIFQERHWDVQVAPPDGWENVSHTGKKLN